MSPKRIVVVGATGNQGGSVINALLAHGGYAVRGLTRDTASAGSQELAAKGVEMLQASLMDRAGLVEAVKGAYAGRTSPMPAKPTAFHCLCGLRFLARLSYRTGRSSMLDAKAEVDKYVKTIGQPTVILHTGSFTENLLNFGQLQRISAGKWQIHFPIAPPDHVQPFTYIHKDVGPTVSAIIDHWEDTSWRQRLTKTPLVMCSYKLCGQEMALELAKLTGTDVTYVAEIDTVPEPLKSMYIFCRDYWDYPGPIPATILSDLGVKIHTFEDFVGDKVAVFMSTKDSE